MTENFHMGDVKNIGNGQPVLDKYENVIQPGGEFTEPSITPDQYDKIMRRLHALECKIILLGQQDYTANEIDRVFDRQSKIEKELAFIKKMCLKIGMALYKKAVK